MRIAVVSSHYPPDFTSGGTLVPQRHARALRERGHDVRVYAGTLSRDEAYSERDETGLTVRWVGVGDAIAWTERHNYDHPRVTADFAAWLAEVQPDVVHLHSLQAMGGDLVRVAKESGARTVVTMHDFWWSCARQFLVDKGFQPCSLVVQAGVCQCEVDRPWLDARTTELARALDHADVVCVPSASARDVAVANGLAPYALVVDENGLPLTAPGPRPSYDGPVRFLYAGGATRLKGVQVMLDALDLLRGTSGWCLTAVGTSPYVIASGWDPGALPMTQRGAYGPEELSEVLHTHDVLVIPSLMRESFSILTREALQHGLAVITSDTLGPEEVVEHDRNGLVVSTGSAEDLAAAMRRLADDRGLLARMQAAEPPAVRTLDDQVDGLERLYTAPLVERATSPIRQVLFIVGIDGAPLRYRVRLPAEALALQGIQSDVRHYRDPSLRTLLARADAVVLYRVPATAQILDLIRDATVPVLFDVDDLVFDPDLESEIPALRVLPEQEAQLWMRGVRRYRTTLEACDAYVGSTELLCEHVTALTGIPPHRFSNGVGLVTARGSDQALRRPRRPGPLRIGYFSGTTTHDRDWQVVEPAVLEVLARHPDAELWLVGHLRPTPAVQVLGDRLHQLPLQDWRTLPELLRDLDVNLAPLELDLGRFNEAKSAIKYLEAALVATPTVATPTQPFREAVRHGVNGVLATTHDEWVAALDELLSDAALRARLGGRARRDVLLELSPHRQGLRYLAILEQAHQAGKPQRTSTWEPVAPDEPPVLVSLDPYTAEPVPAPTRAAVLKATALSHQLRLKNLVAREGVAGIARAGLRRLGRR